MNVENVHSSGHSPVSQIATHILCNLSSTVPSPVLNSFAGTSSGPVALRLAVWRMARAACKRSGGGCCSQYSGSIYFHPLSWYKSSQYSFHLHEICAASVKFLPVTDWIHCRRRWNFESHCFDYLEALPGISFWVQCFQFHAHAFQLLCLSTLDLSLYLSLQFLISILIFAFASLTETRKHRQLVKGLCSLCVFRRSRLLLLYSAQLCRTDC